MEGIGVIFIVISLILSLECDECVKVEFLEWKERFNKEYETDRELDSAFENFQTTRRTTIEHNKKFENGTVSFRMSLNKFADMPHKVSKNRLFSKSLPTSEMEDGTVTIITAGMFPPAPKNFDWIAHGFVTPVKDQGFFCNACWAFSAIAALESHFWIKLGKKMILSEQNIIDCNRNDFTGNWGCDGGSQGSAYKYVQINGIEANETYPYEEDLPHDDVYSCRFNSSKSVGRIKGYYRIRPGNESLVADVVASLGPVAFAFFGALVSFSTYENGIYDDPDCPSGLTHSALIVGFGTEINQKTGNTTDYWLCKNSWSEDWGEKGYFRMVRGKNMCGMTNFLSLPMIV